MIKYIFILLLISSNVSAKDDDQLISTEKAVEIVNDLKQAKNKFSEVGQTLRNKLNSLNLAVEAKLKSEYARLMKAPRTNKTRQEKEAFKDMVEGYHYFSSNIVLSQDQLNALKK